MIKKSQYEILMQCARELLFGKNTKSAFEDIFIHNYEKLIEAHNKRVIELKKRDKLNC